MEKLLSIIMPLYNAEATVEKAVESILSSSKDYFELILVNDGSPDSTAEVLKRFTDDQRVVYVEKENGGLSSARNFGVQLAKGKYVTFPDPDDYYVDGAIDKIEEIINKYDRDVIGFGFYSQLIEKGAVVKTNTNSISEFLDFKTDSMEKEYSYIFNSSKLMTQTAWSRLFRRSIIIDNGLSFNVNTNHAEDVIFFFDFLLYASNLVYLPEILYCYCSYTGSGYSSALEKRKGDTLVPSVSLSFESFLKLKEKYNFNNEFINMMFESFFREYTYCSKKIFMQSNKISKEKRYQLFNEFMDDNGFRYLKDNYFGSYRFYSILFKLYDMGLNKTSYYLYKKKFL